MGHTASDQSLNPCMKYQFPGQTDVQFDAAGNKLLRQEVVLEWCPLAETRRDNP